MSDARERATEAAGLALYNKLKPNDVLRWSDIGGEIRALYSKEAMKIVAAYEAALWQPIETAPRTGETFLVGRRDLKFAAIEAYWPRSSERPHAESSRKMMGVQFDIWRPMPEVPVSNPAPARRRR